ncbi:urea ABC transporter substrate-binding protein [Tautonia plasticadhaerens]|uniref:Aliphatic amidase expression-regulating protein n=1 Tax=Tautonia plasticadhaerens TaxID=2527974 RepID=A0A518GUT6_9BACT|nr:urea ABC transporter substrate-binding protein [Tautonia plasticadhaerens]QDV32352.1 Aliphatic amidase expression-regulating protein [Tautonia plasticadhaerens]
MLRRLAAGVALTLVATAAVVGGLAVAGVIGPRATPITVGILHSRTGPMAESERGVIDATVLALEQLNERGGVLGRPVRWVVADGASDEAVFAREATRLIEEEGVLAIFGCWTSASRKAVRPIVEQSDHLLFYPVQYEGCELSPNIVYLGAAPNQQIIPAVSWSLDRLGTSCFLVGSDYIFPRVANAIIRDQLTALGGRVAGEAYVPLTATAMDELVERIVAAEPDVIFNTINGAANAPFFDALAEATRDRRRIPVVSFSIAEVELQSMGDLRSVVGHYAAWNYFQGLDRPANRSFLAAFRARFGKARAVSDPMEAAYVGVRLWAQTLEEAGRVSPAEVRRALRRQSLEAPEGVVSIDPETQHAWKVARIGRVTEDGGFEVVWASDRPVMPVPYPIFRPRSAWDDLVRDLYTGWGERWSNPAGAAEYVAGESAGPEAAGPRPGEGAPDRGAAGAAGEVGG